MNRKGDITFLKILDDLREQIPYKPAHRMIFKNAFTAKRESMSNRQIYTEKRNEKQRKTVTILGVAIDSIHNEEVLVRIQKTIKEKKKLFITTPNPEIVLEASKDKNLQECINRSDIAIADGTGLVLAGKLINKKIPLYLVKGRELFIHLVQLADEKRWTIVLLGDRQGSAENASQKLQENFKEAHIVGIAGPNLTADGKPKTKEDIEIEKEVIKKIEAIKPQILFVGFGAPRQEKWIDAWRPKLDANICMVVGGTFDYVSGKVPIPPPFWPKSLEWGFRLITQPYRIKRIARALFVFPYTVIRTMK